MNFLDTHFHLDLWPSPEALFQKIEQEKIYTIAVTNTPSVFHFTEKLTKDSKYVRAALGLHPEVVFERHSELELFNQLVENTRYIGEVGLDYAKGDRSNHKLQRQIFQSIIETCANSRNDKILTIHSRRAEKDVIEIIGDRFPGKVILHWYSGNLQELNKALDYGFYFSINNAMIKSKSGKKLIANIPLDRILTESDGPFVLEDNQIPASPMGIKSTVLNLAELLNSQESKIRSQIFLNFRSILE
jgi:TatD DNase family protein